MLKYFLFFLLLFSSSLFALEIELKATFQKEGYTQLNYKVSKIKSFNNESIPLMVYHSKAIDFQKTVKPILFLHGRGFARGYNSNESMMDFLDLKLFFDKQANAQIIFLAPQDSFWHKDSQSIGQDYWLGAEGRFWPKFFSEDFQSIKNEIKNQLSLKNIEDKNTVLGISMGAHGALLLGSLYPSKFQEVFALSPVFRPNINEIPKNDYDVFKPNDDNFMEKFNIGYQIIQGKFSPPKKMSLFISNNDFGLNNSDFPEGSICIEKLKSKLGRDHEIMVYSDNLGHSMEFWKKIFFEIL